MTEPRWTLTMDALRAWALHEDPAVRRWAVGRWMALYPRRDVEQLAVHLMDDDLELQRDVALFLARTGEPRWQAVLLKALELTEGRRRVTMIEALGVLAQPGAVHALAARLRGAKGGVELLAAMHALGRLRVTGAWSALTPLLDLLQADDGFSAALFRLLLDMGRRGDVSALLERWRRWSPAEPPQIGRAFLTWLGCDEDEVALAEDLSRGPAAVLAALGAPGDDEALDAALQRGPRALYRLVHRELVGLFGARRDDLQAWMGDALGRPSEDYRALALGAEALVAALAAVPDDDRAPSEVPLALAALAWVRRREDERRALAGPDPLAAASGLVRAADRVPAPVLALWQRQPASAAAAITALLGEAGGARRVIELAEALTRVASHAPASAPRVVAAHLAADPAPAVEEALVATLRALGPSSAEAVADVLDAGLSEALVRALGELPTETSWRTLSAHAVHGGHIDLAVAEALVNGGDRRALALLAPAWRPGNTPLAAMLVALATLHDADHPDLPSWQRAVDLASGHAAMTRAALGGDAAET